MRSTTDRDGRTCIIATACMAYLGGCNGAGMDRLVSSAGQGDAVAMFMVGIAGLLHLVALVIAR